MREREREKSMKHKTRDILNWKSVLQVAVIGEPCLVNAIVAVKHVLEFCRLH
jgi:hypothetical protein